MADVKTLTNVESRKNTMVMKHGGHETCCMVIKMVVMKHSGHKNGGNETW